MTKMMLHTIATEPITVPTTPSYHLSTTDRIATLEAELFNLQARGPNTISQIKTRAMRAKEAETGNSADPPATTQHKQTPYIEEIADTANRSQNRASVPPAIPPTRHVRIEEIPEEIPQSQQRSIEHN